MTLGTVKTQGTELFVVDKIGSTLGEMLKMACPTGVSGLGGAADQIDDTCLDNTTDKTFKRGLGNPGQVSVPFNLIPSNVSHQLLFAMKEAGTDTDWLVCLSDGVLAPTVSGGDAFVPPANRTSFKFTAYVSDVNIDVATNEIVRGTLTLQRSGAVVPYWNAPAP